jgi:glycosyltransferase involved in cell wall biosynthesis
MKILQAIYQFQTGGGSLQVVADLATAARQAGHHVTVLAKDVPIAQAVGAERFFSGNKLLDGWRLWQRLRCERYDVVHVHDRYCSLLIRCMPHVPPSVQTNHIAYQTRRRLTRFADCVVGCSQAMDRHHAEFFKLPASRRSLIPNGVYFRSPDVLRVAQLRLALPSSWQERRLCLTVARLSPQKGHANLLEAIALLPPALRQTWGFVWAGDGELMPQLRQRAIELGVAADVLLLGQTNAVPEWLALAEAFVLPSLYEGLPLALIEAMAVGLPCLATAIDGNQELLRHGENGLLCAAADVVSLQQGLETLLSDEPLDEAADASAEILRDRLGEQAQKDYWNYWTFERTWRQYEALYQRLCATATAQHLSEPPAAHSI